MDFKAFLLLFSICLSTTYEAPIDGRRTPMEADAGNYAPAVRSSKAACATGKCLFYCVLLNYKFDVCTPEGSCACFVSVNPKWF